MNQKHAVSIPSGETDRALLELAARACGFTTTHQWNSVRLVLSPPVDSLVIERDGVVVHTAWNPLVDSGHTMQLAVILGLTVDCKYHAEIVKTKIGTEWFCESIRNTEPLAATRRAIVNVAAQIGKRLS